MKPSSNLFTAEMIAPCGLDCSLCKRALAETDPCAGCHGPNENKPEFCSGKCGIILCPKRKENGYAFCDECADYPCEDVMEKETRYASKYPLWESPLQNLRLIREAGMDVFLRNEREQWTCGACGGGISVHTGLCSGCGKPYGVQVSQDVKSENEKRLDLRNVYFVIGTSYAGKSTVVKNLARKHRGIALEENYHDAKLPELDSSEFPNLTYTRDLQDWHEFIRRTPDEYVTWLQDVKKECEIVELRMIAELLEKPEARGKKIFVDTNICVETLHRISDPQHVLVMLSDPELGIHRFFDRPDPEKQFLYQLMLEEPDPQAALDNYREILTRVCSRESYNELLHSGFRVLLRDEDRTQEETVRLAEAVFGITAD